MAKPETLKKKLIEHNIDAEIVNKINKDFKNITNKSSKKDKSKYLFNAVNILDNNLDIDSTRKIMESCACSIGSSIDKVVSQFAKRTQNLSLGVTRNKTFRESYFTRE